MSGIALVMAAAIAVVAVTGSGINIGGALKGVGKKGTPPSMSENQDFTAKINNGILKLSDCGAVPDSGYEHGPVIRSAVITAFNNPGTTVEFEPGEYIVSPISTEEAYVFDFKDYMTDGLIIKGNGAMLMITDSFVGAFRFYESKNITVDGLMFDYKQVPWVQGEITAIDERKQEMTVLLDDDNTLMDDPRYKDYQEYIFGVVRDEKNPKLIKKDCLNFFRYQGHQKVKDREYKIRLTSMTPFLGKTMVVGDTFTLNNRGIANASIFNIMNCGAVNFTNITIYANNGCGVGGQFQKGPVMIDNFKILYKPDSNRWITGNSDGIHIQSGTHPVTVQNSVFEGLSDDGISLYQAYSHVTKVVSDTEIEVLGADGGIPVPAAGTTIDIIDERNGKVVGSSTVKEVRPVEGKPAKTYGVLVLDQPVKGVTAGENMQTADLVYVREYMFPGSKIINTIYRDVRGRAVLLRTKDTRVEKCTFENVSAGAIQTHLWNYEGPYCESLVIKGNTMTNINYNWVDENIDNAAAINIRLEIYDTIGQGQGIIHQNITIEDNTFTDYHARAIIGSNVKDLMIRNNVFRMHNLKQLYKRNEAVYLNIAENVTIDSNQFADRRDGVFGVRYQESTVKGLDIKENAFLMAGANQIKKE